MKPVFLCKLVRELLDRTLTRWLRFEARQERSGH